MVHWRPSPVLHDLQVLQLLGDVHAVEPLLLLVDPNLAGAGLRQHLVERQSVLQRLLAEARQLHHLLVALLDARQPGLDLQHTPSGPISGRRGSRSRALILDSA